MSKDDAPAPGPAPASPAASRQKRAHACLAALNFLRANYPREAHHLYTTLPPALQRRLDDSFGGAFCPRCPPSAPKEAEEK